MTVVSSFLLIIEILGYAIVLFELSGNTILLEGVLRRSGKSLYKVTWDIVSMRHSKEGSTIEKAHIAYGVLWLATSAAMFVLTMFPVFEFFTANIQWFADFFPRTSWKMLVYYIGYWFFSGFFIKFLVQLIVFFASVVVRWMGDNHPAGMVGVIALGMSITASILSRIGV